MTCRWCAGECDGVHLDALLGPELAWIWEQLGVIADRRGDTRLTGGTATLTGPADPGMPALSRDVEDRVEASTNVSVGGLEHRAPTRHRAARTGRYRH